MRRLQSLAIAIVALALSAAGVFAARSMPSAATPGLTTATEASGHSVPVRSEAAPSSDQTTDEDTEEDAAAAAHPDNHGAVVSEAARAETPDGWANHGAYVSSIAKQNAGQDTAASHRSGTPKEHQASGGKPTP